MTPKKFALALLVLALISVLPASAAPTGHFERTLQVSGAVTLDVISGSGNVTIRTGNSTTVQINAKIHGNTGSWLFGGGNVEEKIKKIEQNPPVVQQGSTIRIGRFEDRELARNISIDYDITVPAQTNLTSRTGSGDQSISGLMSGLTAKAGSGDITLDNNAGSIRVEAGSGDVKINGVKGSLDTSTGSGNIRAENIVGEVVAHSGSGNIEIQQIGPGDVRVETGSGNIKLRGLSSGLRANTGSGDIRAEGAPGHDWRMGTGSGSITLKIPSQASFTLDARTSSGDFRIDHPVNVEEKDRRHLRAKAGNGGPLLDLHTGSGNIELD